MIVIYTTLPSLEKGQEIAELMLQQRLIACATIIPCASMYWWNNEIQKDQEVILLMKSEESRFDVISEALTQVHPYQVPCILTCEATANAPYLQWLMGEIK